MFIIVLHSTPIIFRQPRLATITNIFVLSLNYDVWWAILFIIIIIWLVMLSQYIYPAVRQQMSNLDIIGFILGAACQQGTHLIMSNSSGRIIVLNTFILSLFVFTFYSANILVLLQIPSHAIRNIDDLLMSPLKLAVQDARYLHFYYETDTINGLMNRVYETKLKPNGPKSWIYDTAMGVKKVCARVYCMRKLHLKLASNFFVFFC